jgi:hypothetical protein
MQAIGGTPTTGCDESESRRGGIESNSCSPDNEEKRMNDYQPRTPRALLGLAAVAMTAATLAASVLVPARMQYGTREIEVLTQSDVATQARTAASTASIDVVAVRGTRIVPVAQ